MESLMNHLLSIEVNPKGAELMSIKSVQDNLEYLWQGNPVYWKRRSPLLFPIVGALKDNHYEHSGEQYEMELHGFVKDMVFKLTGKSENRLIFTLSDDENTKRKYPFDFLLQITYELQENNINISHMVKNTGGNTLWFSIGEHPGFNCPLLSNETMEDYSLVFEKNECTSRRFLVDGLLWDEEEKFLDNDRVIRLSHELFERRAILLKNLQSGSVTLKSRNHDREVTVSFKGYPYLGIWSLEAGAPFVCIEPWYGISSKIDGDLELKEKEGILSLESGQEFKCSYSISIQ